MRGSDRERIRGYLLRKQRRHGTVVEPWRLPTGRLAPCDQLGRGDVWRCVCWRVPWAAGQPRGSCAPHTRRETCIVRAGPELDQGHCGYGRTACCAPASESAVCGLWRVVCCVRWAGETSAAHRKMQDLPSGAARGGARAVQAHARNRRRARWRNQPVAAAEAFVSSLSSLRRALPQPPPSWRRRGPCAPSRGSRGRRSPRTRHTRASRRRCR
mmetsp:Transcript_17028/g.40585  ORF Transcript_17028/g.40585 Transcript_17028/m.40585 type:complete len:213 (-) Transcript_17028:436-1074(-)